MGLIGRVLSWVQNSTTQVKFFTGGPNVTATHFQQTGDDSLPLKDDYAVLVALRGAGEYAVAGYVDKNNEKKASNGERRIYARDSSGNSVVEVWLKNTGDIAITNDNGKFIMSANGDIDINGVIISPGGNIKDVNSLIAGNKQLVNHIHPAGEPPGNTGTNL